MVLTKAILTCMKSHAPIREYVAKFKPGILLYWTP